MIDSPTQNIKYNFLFQNGHELDFDIHLNCDSMEYMTTSRSHYPEWTKIDYEPRCDQCPIADSGAEYCPIAVNLIDVVKAFKDSNSYDIVNCKVETQARTYLKADVSIQTALSSLLGIIMVTSGCPAMDKLRPMVKFHLPFASIEETIYRASAMYLLAQYFRKKQGNRAEIELDGLIAIYKRIDHINARLCRRLRSATNKDASLNAVVVLDVFAKMIPMSVEETLLSFDNLFSGYID
ncbi:MAG: hypothetical protein HQ528_12040 [Candidatus Marinimicrobia bacterium]|nr:hypothetical protein [Candidatus Neomarinimicrobiota bacterium]